MTINTIVKLFLIFAILSGLTGFALAEGGKDNGIIIFSDPVYANVDGSNQSGMNNTSRVSETILWSDQTMVIGKIKNLMKDFKSQSGKGF